jgi:hypothetical protein
MCHLKSLIFDCINFTEGLITILSTADSEAQASIRTFVTSVFPWRQDLWRKMFFFYVMMTTELFIKYFCSIKLCCLWRFDENLFVFKYCFILIVLGQHTSTQGSIGQFNHTIRTRSHRMLLIFYFLHFRSHSSCVTWRV